jgi:hypothetical protein
MKIVPFVTEEDAKLLDAFRAMTPRCKKRILHTADLFRWSADDLLEKIKAGSELDQDEEKEYREDMAWFHSRLGIALDKASNVVEFRKS